MRRILLFFAVIQLINCREAGIKKENTNIVKNPVDTVSTAIHRQDAGVDEANIYDSIAKTMDTSSLAGKRAYVMNRFLSERPMDPEDDTLFDINYDGHKDYLIRGYGKSGTGIKNGVEVYIYFKSCHCYLKSEQLSAVRNPTFYIQDKKITGFYLGHGGGGGEKLEWMKGRWRKTKEFTVDNEDDSTKWIIRYPLKRKTETFILPYQMIPPERILETDIRF